MPVATPLPSIIAKCREISLSVILRAGVSSRFGLGQQQTPRRPLVHRFFDSNQFEDLAIPTAIVATDLGTVIPWSSSRASLADAIRASCAFPGAFFEAGHDRLRGAWPTGVWWHRCPRKPRAKLGAETVVGVSVGLHDGPPRRSHQHLFK